MIKARKRAASARRQRGSVVLYAALFFLAVVGTSILYLAEEGREASYENAADLQQRQAMLLAESALEGAVAKMRTTVPSGLGLLNAADCSLTAFGGSGSVSLGAGSYRFTSVAPYASTCTDNCTSCTVSVEGKAENASAKISMALAFAVGQGISGYASAASHKLKIPATVATGSLLVHTMGIKGTDRAGSGTRATISNVRISSPTPALNLKNAFSYSASTNTNGCQSTDKFCAMYPTPPTAVSDTVVLSDGNAGKDIVSLGTVLTALSAGTNYILNASFTAVTGGAAVSRSFESLAVIFEPAAGKTLGVIGKYGEKVSISDGTTMSNPNGSNTLSGSATNPLLTSNPWCDWKADTLVFVQNSVVRAKRLTSDLDGSRLYLGPDAVNGTPDSAPPNSLAMQRQAVMLSYDGLQYGEIWSYYQSAVSFGLSSGVPKASASWTQGASPITVTMQSPASTAGLLPKSRIQLASDGTNFAQDAFPNGSLVGTVSSASFTVSLGDINWCPNAAKTKSGTTCSFTNHAICAGICAYFKHTGTTQGKTTSFDRTPFLLTTRQSGMVSAAGGFTCLSGVDSSKIAYVPGLRIRPGGYWSDF